MLVAAGPGVAVPVSVPVSVLVPVPSHSSRCFGALINYPQIIKTHPRLLPLPTVITLVQRRLRHIAAVGRGLTSASRASCHCQAASAEFRTVSIVFDSKALEWQLST